LRAGDRQRLLDALAHRFSGEVPFVEYYVAETIVDRVMGTSRGKHMLQLDAADLVEFLRRTSMDAGYVCGGWFLGRRNKVDEHGRVHYIDGTIKSRADFDQIQPPSFDPVRRRIEGFLEQARDTHLGCTFAPDMATSLAFTAIGPNDFLRAVYDDPAFLDEFMDRVEEYTLPLAECALAYPVDAVLVTGPMCCKDGPIISPEMHERFIFPRLQKVLDIIRPRGVPVILHSDGDNSAFMDWIVERGLAGLHPIEPCSDRFDIFELKRRYGDRICLCGNIDVGRVLSRGTPDQVRRNTLEHLERLSPGGGYVCGSSHDITENIPYENFRAMAETICSYRRP